MKKLLRRLVLLAWIPFVFVLLLNVALWMAKRSQPDNNNSALPVNSSLVFAEQLTAILWQQVNDWRLEQGQLSYFSDETLCKFAQQRLTDVNQQNLSHAAFWPKATDLLPESGFTSLAENLASYNYDANQTIEASELAALILSSWLASPSHLQNLQQDFTNACLVCEHNVCIQVFGRY